MKRCSVLFQRPSWRSALKVSRPQTPNWKRNTDSWVLDHSNMKLVAVFVFLAYCLAVGVDSASVSLSTNSMTLNGNAHIQFYGPREEIWNGLSDGKILNDSYTFFTHSVVGETADRFISRSSDISQSIRRRLHIRGYQAVILLLNWITKD